MKAAFSLAALLLASSLSAFANDATCLDNHEEEAAVKYANLLTANIKAALTKKGIALDEAKDPVSVEVSQYNFPNDGIYGYVSLVNSTITTTKGTELLVEYKQRSWNEAEAAVHDYFKPRLKSAGFDREGNAIAAHCSLVSDEVRVNDRAEFIYITNATTGRFITRVELPKKISVY